MISSEEITFLEICERRNMNHYHNMTWKLAWNLAAPPTWVASAIPAIFGILYCRVHAYPLAIWTYLPLFLACVLLQSAVNTLNDYMDFIKGTDSADDHVEEDDAVLVYGGIRPKSALLLGIGFMASGIILGLLSGLQHGMAPLLIGLIGVAVIALYSCGPHPISYLPVGELISGCVMGGLIPLGICACADGKLHGNVLVASLPLILGIALIMMSNNGCDIEKDMAAGRKTFPVTLGRKKTRIVYRACLLCWLILLMVGPIVLLGNLGICNLIFLLLFAGKPFLELWRLSLLPETRILQMKTIAKANLMGNGSYCLTILIYCLWHLG